MSLAATDTETHRAQPGLAAPPIVCASIANSTGAHLVEPERWLAWLECAARDPAAHVVGCNLVYDLVCAAAARPSLLEHLFAAVDEGRVHDVAIREALADIARGDLVERGADGIGIRYGLRLLAQRHLGLDLSAEKSGPDAWRKRYAELDGVPFDRWPWSAKVYPMRDAAFPLEIYKRQEGAPNLHDESAQVRAALALQLASAWGVRANGERVAALRARVQATDRENTARFQEAGIIRADGTENKARLAEIVTRAYGGIPPRTAPSRKFPQGQVASDRDTLVESGDPLLEAYGRAGKNDKYLTTYLPILEQAVEQPWNPEFNVLVATSRVSSNAQQFPQQGGVRECFEPRPGWVFCSVDYGGLELRTMSQRAIWVVGFSRMATVLNAGQDPHVLAASSFLGATYDPTLARYKSGDAEAKAFRDLGKIYNFGKGGGMGPGAMVYQSRKGQKGETTRGPDGTVYLGSRFCILAKQAHVCGTRKVPIRVQGKERRICAACLDVAKQLDAGWLAAWPEQRELFRRASALAKSQRYLSVEIPVARLTRGKCGYTQWLNTPFQGLGAVATKRAMWRVSREMYVPGRHDGGTWTRARSALLGSRLVLQVHDELIAEMPEDLAPEAGDRMAFLMRESLAECVPDLVPSIEADPALSRTMSKSAKTVRDAAGRLQVWEG